MLSSNVPSSRQTIVLMKKFLIALVISVYSVAPVFAEDSDRVRGHWQWQGAKMLNLKADQKNAWAHLKKAYLKGMRGSVQDRRLRKKRFRIAFQGSTDGVGLISRYKREYQIAIGQSLSRHQRLLEGVPSDRFRRDQIKGSGMHRKKGSGKSWGKGCNQGWGEGHSKNSKNRYGLSQKKGAGMRWDKGTGKRWDRLPDDKWQNYRKKKSFESD